MKAEAGTMVRWFWWPGWSTDEVEGWLEEKAAAGWHLDKVDRMLLRFRFVRGAPKAVRFCADYPGEVNDEYGTIFSDAGWELVGQGAGWYIWRAEYEVGERPQAFTDVESLIDRHQRLLLILSLGLVGLTMGFVAQLPLRATGMANTFLGWFGRVLLVVYIPLAALLVGSLMATYRRIQRLRARHP